MQFNAINALARPVMTQSPLILIFTLLCALFHYYALNRFRMYSSPRDKQGFVEKDVLTVALRAHKAAVDATKSPQREAAEKNRIC